MNELFWASYVVLWLVVAAASFAFLETLRQLGAIRRRVGQDQGASLLSGAVETGAALPELVGIRAATEEPAAWSHYLQHRVGVAVFVSPRCPRCSDVAEGTAKLAHTLGKDIDVLAVIQGARSEAFRFVDETGLPASITVVDEYGATAERLGIAVTPAAMTIRDGRIGIAGVVNDGYQVESLVEKELTEPTVIEGDDTSRTSEATRIGGARS